MSIRVPRSFRRASTLGAAVAAPLLLYVLFAGRAGLAGYRYTSDFYDVQARRLFDGRLDVPLERFGLEAFRSGDEFHTYFGVFPTLLRMPVLALTDAFDGRLVQPSMLLAVVVGLVGLVGLGWRIRVLLRGDAAATPVDALDRAVAAGLPVAFGLGSVVLFLASTTVVYHEAILWGVAGTILALDRLLVATAAPSPRTIAAFGAATAVAVLSRAAVGFAPVVAALVLVAARTVLPSRLAPLGRLRGVAALRRWFGGDATSDDPGGPSATLGAGAAPGRSATLGRSAALGLVAAVVLPLAAHVAVNHARFGTPLSPPYGEQVWTEISPERREALAANGGSLFNVGYIPSTLLAYGRPDGIEPGRLFPFLHFPTEPATVVGDVVFDTRDRTASLTAASPLLTLLAAVGLVGILRDRRLAVLRPLVLGSLVAVGGVLTIGFIAERYVGDFLPLLAVASVPGAYATGRWGLDGWRDRGAGWRVAIGTVGGLLVAWTLWANLALALSYQRLFVPHPDLDRRDFIAVQLRIDDRLPGSIGHERSAESPTTVGPAGTFRVVGDCEELWWSDGFAWDRLEPTPGGRTPLCNRLTR